MSALDEVLLQRVVGAEVDPDTGDGTNEGLEVDERAESEEGKAEAGEVVNTQTNLNKMINDK